MCKDLLVSLVSPAHHDPIQFQSYALHCGSWRTMATPVTMQCWFFFKGRHVMRPDHKVSLSAKQHQSICIRLT